MPVAELGLGCWQFAGTFGFWGDQPREDSIQTIHAALRGGVRHFDTAQGYGNGRSEQMVGQQLRRFRKEFPRDSLTIATKVMPMSPDKLKTTVERSLRRLCTPYIDILYLHWPDSKTETGPLLETMSRLKAEGAVRQIGVSNFPPFLLEKTCRNIQLDWVQCAGSLLWTKNLAETIRICKREGMKTALYSPLGMGLLTGRYRTAADLPEGDARRKLFCFQPECEESWNHLLDRLQTYSERLSCTPGQLALAWALSQDVSIVVGGARNKHQLAENLTAEHLSIPQNMMEGLADAALRVIPREQDNIFGHAW